MERVDVCIVGAGPAGLATAAALVKLRPRLRDHLVIIEKSRHPRHKLCGGGLTPFADKCLRELELTVAVPELHVRTVRFFLAEQPVTFEMPGMMRTIRRNEFDAAMARAVQHKGVRLLEDTAVRHITEAAGGIRLTTSGGDFLAKIVVGADGAKSLVRRALFRDNPSRVSRLIEVLVPARNGALANFESRTVTIDFRPMRQGLQGYLWNFPCWVESEPFFNVGLFDSRIHDGPELPRADMPAILNDHLRSHHFEPVDGIMGHPERWFHPADRLSRPHTLLVGDSAGVEPWLGEGIGASLAYGPVAAATIVRALETSDYSLSDYDERILQHRVGRFLRRNRVIAKWFYHRRVRRVLPFFLTLLKIYMRLTHRPA